MSSPSKSVTPFLKLLPSPTGEEAQIRKLAQDICNEWVRPYANEDDQNKFFRKDAYKALAQAGLASVVTPKKYGGLELSSLCYFAAIEEIAHASLAMSITCGVNNLPQGALLKFGTEEQKQRYLPGLCSGEILGAFGLSEPGSGSDAAGLQTSARKVDGGYVLNGSKCWCSNTGDADLCLVMARTSPERTKGITSFLIEKDLEGFQPGKLEDKLGLRSSTLGELVFEDCFVPEGNRIGEEGQGLGVALSQLGAGRVVIAAGSLGLARSALELAWDDRCRRQKEQTPEEPGFETVFPDHFAELQAASGLIREAASLKDSGQCIRAISSQSKMKASDLAMKVSSDALSYMGRQSATTGSTIERLFRDAKSLQIVEGTNQIQRLVLTRELDRQWADAQST